MKILLTLLLLLLSIHADDLSFANKNNKTIYTLVLFATQELSEANRLLKRVPQTLQKETNLYKSGNYYTARFTQSHSYKHLKQFRTQLQKAGFHGVYISQLSTQQMQRELLTKQKKATKRAPQSENSHKKISNFSVTDMILKANRAYKSGNEFDTIMYYEILLKSGYADKKMKNNLCYLYGKRGDWDDAQRVINQEHYQSKFLYAYAYGALQSNQKNYYDTLSENIIIDRSGLLALLTASYFEKNAQKERASFFYRMAYEKNPSNPYIVYAYARDADISLKRDKAKKYYKEVLEKVGMEHQLYKTVRKRLLQIGV